MGSESSVSDWGRKACPGKKPQFEKGKERCPKGPHPQYQVLEPCRRNLSLTVKS